MSVLQPCHPTHAAAEDVPVSTLLDTIKRGACLCALSPAVLQKKQRLLRRLRRVLTCAHADPVLLGLFQHRLARSHCSLSDTLVRTALAHKQLRAAFDGAMGRNGWGVLHRALRLLAELCTLKQVGRVADCLIGVWWSACLEPHTAGWPLITCCRCCRWQRPVC